MCIDPSPSRNPKRGHYLQGSKCPEKSAGYMSILNVNINQRKWVEYVLSIHSVQSSWNVKTSTKTAGNDEKKITTHHRGERLCQLCLKCRRTKEEVGKEGRGRDGWECSKTRRARTWWMQKYKWGHPSVLVIVWTRMMWWFQYTCFHGLGI